MNNKLPKPAEKALEKLSSEKVKEIVFSIAVTGDINPALNKLKDELLPIWMNGTPAEKKRIEKTLSENVSSIMYGFETETHLALMEGFIKRLQGGAKEICKQLIHDFDCKTNAEKIMAETAAVAFVRYLDASRRLNNCLELNDAGGNKVAFMAMISKERDRAHRQYLSTISMIKQLKAPAIEMNIRAKTAFVSQNQQINAPQQTKENNEPK